MNVVFIIPDFKQANLRLQPWLTFYRVALELKALGQHVVVISDNTDFSEKDDIPVFSVSSLRSAGGAEIEERLTAIKPDKVFVTVTPLSLVTNGWYKLLGQYSSFAYLSYAFYNFSELYKAAPHLQLKDKIAFMRLLMVPKSLWRRVLEKYFTGVIAQSKTTRLRMQALCGDAVKNEYIPPGTDWDVWNREGSPAQCSENKIVFLGSPYAIRGFYILLDAIAKLGRKDISLRILARGADESRRQEIMAEARQRGIEDCVEVEGGWLEIDELRSEIQRAKAVALPFVLVPSELPVTVYESIACGTPVIGTKIDGLPSAVGKAGLLVDVADSQALADAIGLVCDDDNLYREIKEACIEQQALMPDWQEVGSQWNHL